MSVEFSADQLALWRHQMLYGMPALKPGDIIHIDRVTGEVSFIKAEKRAGPQDSPAPEDSAAGVIQTAEGSSGD